MQLHEAIKRGALHIEDNFFTPEIFKEIQHDLVYQKGSFIPTFQPFDDAHYNRFAAYPCHEFIWKKYDKYAIEKITFLLGCSIKNYNSFFRRTLTEDLKKAPQVNQKYGLVHYDDNDFAGVLYFDDSVNSGTAFYNKWYERHPYTEIGAFPNRCVLYDGRRYHSCCSDFNLKASTKYLMFFDRK